MRTGAEYRAALRDGRRVWVFGEGLIDDVTTHPATRAMVDEYVAWYDLHFDPEWIDVLFSPRDAEGERSPGHMQSRGRRMTSIGMGRGFAKTTFLSAGNITHTPAYGNLIALGVITAAQEYNAPAEQIANAVALPRRSRRDRAVSDLLRRCGDDRLSHARRPERTQRTALGS